MDEQLWWWAIVTVLANSVLAALLIHYYFIFSKSPKILRMPLLLTSGHAMASIASFSNRRLHEVFFFPSLCSSKHPAAAAAAFPGSGRKLPPFVRFASPEGGGGGGRGGEQEPDSTQSVKNDDDSMLRPWDVPWDWKVTAGVMMPYLMSIAWNIVVGLPGLKGPMPSHSVSMLSQLYGPDEVAARMLFDQLLKSAAKLTILYVFVYRHQPFPPDIFKFRWSQPLSYRDGWIIWAMGGLLVACVGVAFVKILLSTTGAIQTPNETDSLVGLLPLIGASEISTICLLGILGILAPVCEETIYRGFLMTSLTKWFSVPVSVTISSAVFALSHQSPGKSLEIFLFGTVLGLTYARTRNLLAPITIHACWNSAVILILTYLHSEGHEIQKYVL